MGARSGSYSVDLYDESLQYMGALLQQGVPLIDGDWNDQTENMIANLRRAIEFGIGDGSPNTGFRIDESGTSNVNNFTIKGGSGTIETAGRCFNKGFPALLVSDLEYTANTNIIHPQITGLTDTVLTDSSANYVVNELVGRDLVPDVANPGTTIAITANTATTITVASGLLAATAVGTHYRVNLSTPGSNRTDFVFLDCFLDEIDSVEDTNLLHTGVPPSASNVEAARRLKLRTFVKVTEGQSSPTDYTDSDGNYHAILELAQLDRLSADTTVTTAMISDSRVYTPPRPDILDTGTPVLSAVSEIDINSGLSVSINGQRATISVSGTAALSPSFHLEDFDVISGITPPTEATFTDYEVLVFATGVENGVKSQFPIPSNIGAAGNITLRAVISMDSADTGDVVIDTVTRINGSVETTDQRTLGVSDSADVFEVFEIETLTTLSAHDAISVKFKRRGDLGSDTHTGGMRLHHLIVEVAL